MYVKQPQQDIVFPQALNWFQNLLFLNSFPCLIAWLDSSSAKWEKDTAVGKSACG